MSDEKVNRIYTRESCQPGGVGQNFVDKIVLLNNKQCSQVYDGFNSLSPSGSKFAKASCRVK